MNLPNLISLLTEWKTSEQWLSMQIIDSMTEGSGCLTTRVIDVSEDSVTFSWGASDLPFFESSGRVSISLAHADFAANGWLGDAESNNAVHLNQKWLKLQSKPSNKLLRLSCVIRVA